MGLTITKGPEMDNISRIDEATSARLYLTSDKKVVVSEGDVRARILLSRHGDVTRGEAQHIRQYKNGDLYLYEKGTEPPIVPDVQVGPRRPIEAVGTPIHLEADDTIDFSPYAGTVVRNLGERDLRRLTYVAVHRKWAEAEEARRAGKPVKKVDAVIPPPPAEDEASLALAHDDVVDFGKYEGTAVKDLTDKYIKTLSTGSTVKHRNWATAEIARRASE